MSLSALAVRRPVTTAMFFIGSGLLGLVSLSRIPVELLPELVYPEIYVIVAQRAYSAEQVERELLMPVEAEVGQLEGVVEIESSATFGRGTVIVAYAPGTDMKFALLQVQQSVSQLQAGLPEQTVINVQRFDTSALSSAVMELQVLGEGDLNWLRDFTEERIRPDLEAVEGVVAALPLGGQQRAVEVIVRPELLAAHNLSMNDVNSALEAVNQPRAYVGRVVDGHQVYPVSIHGQFSALRQIHNVLVKPEIPLRLADVAHIRYGLLERTDLSRVNGLASVSIRVQKEDEANLLTVAEEVEATIARLSRELAPEGVTVLVNSSQADLMNEALDTLRWAAIVGVFLGLVVLFLFLRNVRFVGVLLLAIPASLLLTFNAMYAWGLTLNVLSLCGLALSMGMLADNGIVVMESVFKHFEQGKAAEAAAREGTAEVSRAVIAATGTTICVFLPVVFIRTDFQDILRQLALSITFPLLASLLVALTLVPMMSARTLAHTTLRPLETGRLLGMYTVVLKSALRHRVRVSATVGVTLFVTLVVAFFLMLQQESAQQESQFTVYVELGEGATLEGTDQVVSQVEAAVGDIDEWVESFTASVQPGYGSVNVSLVDLIEKPERPTVSEIQERLEESTDRIEGGVITYEAPTGGGGGAGVGGGTRIGASRRSGGFNLLEGPPPEMAVIRGHDFAVLQMIADDLAYRLEGVEEVDPGSIGADLTRSAPEAQVLPDAVAMFDRGVEITTILATIEAANPQGTQARTSFLEPDGTETPIEVRITDDPETDKLTLAELRLLPILTPSGNLTPIEEVARVRADEGRNGILRTDQSRRVVVSFRYEADVLESQPRTDAARAFVRAAIQDLVLPPGYSIEVIEAEVDTIYYWMMAIAALVIYMILASLFESITSPIVILATLPTAVIGSCWALLLTGTGLSSQAGPMALLGFIVLIGIAVNNGIILIDSISTLRSRSGFRRERAVLAAGRSRVRPILMTSATTLLGVLPLALEFGGDFEIWPPFAITVLGGLAVSMASTLVFVPVVYMGIDQVRDWLRRIGLVGVTLATAAAGLVVYGVWVGYRSTFWATVVAVPIWFFCLSLVWAAIRTHRARAATRAQRRPVYGLRLHTLTKIYGAPGRMRRDWGRFARRDARVRQAGEDPVNRRAVADGLLWKLPLLLLVGFLHTYVEDPLWLFVLAVATWAFVAHLAACGGRVLLGDRYDRRAARRAPRIARFGLRHGLFAGLLVYLQLRLGAASVTVAVGVLWMLAHTVKTLARRVADGKVDVDHLDGRLAWLRRLAYRGAAAVPILGVPRRQHVALAGVDLEIGRGMFGLLGPNGAGKTTLMRTVCQLLEPTYGSVTIEGRALEDYDSLHGLIGYLPQRFGLYDHMTGREYLEYRALLEGFRERGEREQRVLACLEQVNLRDRMDDPIGSYSGGMRQRIGIAQTLLHMPQIVVVDEPTAGLDPVERIRFRNLLARLSRERIVIFSTHIVEDVAGSCNRLAVLNQGRLLYAGPPAAMREQAAGRVWETVLPEETFVAVERELHLVTHLRTPAGIRARFLAAEAPEGIPASRVEPTLEDAYLHLLQRHRSQPC